MPSRPPSARDPPVRDLADQRVREPVLRLSRNEDGERRHEAAADELSHAGLGRAPRRSRARPTRRARTRCPSPMRPARAAHVGAGSRRDGRRSRPARAVGTAWSELATGRRSPSARTRGRTEDCRRRAPAATLSTSGRTSPGTGAEQSARVSSAESSGSSMVPSRPGRTPLPSNSAGRASTARRRSPSTPEIVATASRKPGLRPVQVVDLDDERACGGRLRKDTGPRTADSRAARSAARRRAHRLSEIAQQRLEPPEQPRLVRGRRRRERRTRRDARPLARPTRRCPPPRRTASATAERHGLAVGETRPATQRGVRPSVRRNSPTSRDLPIPGSPTTVTSSRLAETSRAGAARASFASSAGPADERRGVIRRPRAPLAEHPPHQHRLRLALHLRRRQRLGLEGSLRRAASPRRSRGRRAAPGPASSRSC